MESISYALCFNFLFLLPALYGIHYCFLVMTKRVFKKTLKTQIKVLFKIYNEFV